MSAEPYLRSGMVLVKRYRVGERLARGGFGEVYRAFDLRIERDVALKYVFQNLDLETLRNEVSILARNAERLKFIPNIYDHWRGTRQHAGYFIVMEFVEGETLDKRRRLPWPADEVILFLRVLLRNLHDLHRSSIVHCDIKPVNIKAAPPSDLAYQMPYRILDFGIAKQGDETTIQASSPHFAAPEQYRLGEQRLKLDLRADLYSLAATAYYLLTDRRPPGAEIRYANVYEHRYADPLVPPGQLVEAVPKALEQTLLEMLQIDRDRRPSSAEEALQRLDQRLAAEALVPDGPEPAQPTVLAPHPPAGVDETVRPLVTELTDEPLSAASVIPTGDITPAALPRSGPPAAGPPPTPSVQPAQGTLNEPRVVPGPQTYPERSAPAIPRLVEVERHGRGVITCLAWSPDGQSLLVATTLGIYRLDANGPGCALWRPSAAPVQQLGYVCEGSALLITAGGVIEALAHSDDALTRHRPALPVLAGTVLTAPRGRTVAALSEATLQVFNLDTGVEEAAWRLSPRLQGQVVALSADGQTVAIGDGDRLWCHSLRAELRERRWNISELPQPMVDLSLTPDGEMAAVASTSAVVVWTRGEARAQTILSEPTKLSRIVLTGDGQTIALATALCVSLRRTTDGKPSLPLAQPELAGAAHLAVCPNDRLLAAASSNEVRIWRLRDGGLQRREGEWTQDIRALASLHGGTGLVAAGPWAFQPWSVVGERLVPGPALPGASTGPYAVAVGADMAQAALLGAGELRLADLATGRELRTLEVQPAQAHSLAFRAGGAELCMAALDGVERYAVATGAALPPTLTIDRRAIELVAFDGGERVAVAATGGVTIYGLEDGAERCAVQLRGAGEITAIALSADGNSLVIAHREQLALWRVDTQRPDRLDHQQLAPGPGVHQLIVAADGASIAALRGSSVELWDVRSDKLHLIGAAQGHTGRVGAAALLDAGLLATAAHDGTLRLWRRPEAPDETVQLRG